MEDPSRLFVREGSQPPSSSTEDLFRNRISFGKVYRIAESPLSGISGPVFEDGPGEEGVGEKGYSKKRSGKAKKDG